MRKENSMKKVYVLILLIGLVGVISLVGLRENLGDPNGSVILVIKTLGKTTQQTYEFNGGNALGLLETQHEVELNGELVKCIQDICSNKEYLWVFLVNNETINYGPGSYRLRDKDIITFEFRKW